MKTKDIILVNNIKKHKEYFDQKLIETLEYLERHNAQVQEENNKMSVRNQKLIKQNQDLKLKTKDQKAIQYQLSQKLKDKEEEIANIIKDFEKEIKKQEKAIKEQGKIIHEELRRANEENEKLRREIEKLRKENNRYHKMNKRNSDNSSIPPSNDTFRRVANSRTKSGLKRGGQKGHPHHHIGMKESADKIITKYVRKAPVGAEAVFNEEKEIQYYRTQEINAKVKTEIVETRYYISEEGKPISEKKKKQYRISSVTYHDDFKAMMIYLNSKGTIPLNRLCTMMKELSMGKIKVSESTVVSWEKEFYQKSQRYQKELLKALKEEKVLHVDETGWRINGKNTWMHVIASEQGAYFIVSEKRKDTQNGPLSILSDYEGCLIHDHYKAYYDLMRCEHGECNAHILRYLKEGAELDKNKACKEMIELIQSMIHEKKSLMKAGKMKMEENKIISYESKYLEILEGELKKYHKEHPKKEKAKYVPGYIKLMKRMVEYKEEHLRFIKDFIVPSDNNIAERQMRPTKAKKNISGQSSSLETANHFAAIHTVVQTCSLQNKNTLEEIKAILRS